MTKMKFYTLDDLIATGIPMFDGTVSPDIEVGEVYLSDRVISMWDFNFSSRKGKYIYYDNAGDTLIEKMVEVCKRVDETGYECVPLEKDLSNINVFENPELLERTDDETK